jgi:hypothetical protein
VTEQYNNKRIEAGHGRPQAWLRPMTYYNRHRRWTQADSGLMGYSDIAAVTLASDLRGLQLAQRSAACSPRLPGVAVDAGHRAPHGPLGGVARPSGCPTVRIRLAAVEDRSSPHP